MKNFDELVTGRKKEPFKLGGQTFTIRARLHSRRFARMLKDCQDAEGAEASIDAAGRFMNRALIVKDRERFQQLIDGDDDDDDDAKVVTFEQLRELVDWCVDHYTGKHDTQEESSTPGSPPTPTPRNVVSFQPTAKNQAS
jgi:hypothetical protein